MKRVAVDVAPGDYAIARLPTDAEPPAGLFANREPALVSVTRTPDELSVVCPAELAPESSDVRGGWRLLTVRGPLVFTLTGIMASLAGTLAAAGVSLFAVSTYDTDHILVQGTELERAIDALTEAGHEVHRPQG